MNTVDNDRLTAMLTRLKLTAIRDRLDSLLDEAARQDLNLRETVAYLLEAEIAYKDQRRITMGTNIAKFPFVRTIEGFEFDAQPSIDPKQIRELATSRWVANGDTLLLRKPDDWHLCPDGAERIAACRTCTRKQIPASVRW